MIYVLGSINADLVVYSDEFPKTGETIVGKEFFVNQGGKGANQAIAARKAGAETTFIGRVGEDYFGEIVVKNLVDNDVTLQIRKEDNTYTGIALINVNSIGENKIIIIHGANSKVNGEELTFLEEKITGDDILMLQGEIDSDILLGAAKIAKNKNAAVIFDPAPANKKLRNVIPFADFITPNEVEIKSLAENNGTEGLFAMGAKNVIKKLGEKGIFYEGKNGSFAIPAFRVSVVDTTGAGDTFNGAFAAALSEGKTLKESIIFGVAAAAISVTRKGAATSFPSRGEIEDFLLKRKNI